jgi:hypothetical protein
VAGVWVMNIRDFLKRKRTDDQDCQLEQLLKEGIYKLHYKSFFEVFLRSPVIILGVQVDADKVQLQTTTCDDGRVFGYVYTSHEALNDALKLKRFPNHFLEVSGKAALQMFLEAQAGMHINAELNERVSFAAGNIRFIATELKIDRSQAQP